MFLEELEDLKDRYPERFQLLHVLSREPQEVELFSGRLDADRMGRISTALLPAETVDEWFLCGPFGWSPTCARCWSPRACPSSSIHAEVFHVEAAAAGPSYAGRSAEPSGCRGHHHASTAAARRSRWPPTARRCSTPRCSVRADAPFACKGGVCGTCRAKVLEGTVEMDTNWALEPDEVEKGYVLTCQSHPTIDSVVLDYDA